MGSSEQLYRCEHRVTVKEREERMARIQVAIERVTLTSPLLRREIQIRLTDETDLQFLFTLRLGEDDFQVLKQQQGLLVDFGAFAQKLIDLLQLCQAEEGRDAPRYILQLSPGPDHWCLNVVETNPFKHLTHLSLRFLAGSDADVRDYLAACLKKLRTDSGQAAKAASATEADLRSRLERCQEQLAGRSAELERLRTDVETRSQEAAAKAAAELAYERQKTTEAQQVFQSKYERDRRELEQAHLRIVKQLETQNSELTASCKSLQEENFRLELQLKEATARATRLEESESQLRRELDAAKHDRDGLGRTRQEQEAAVHQLTTRVAVLEQELKDKDALLARTGDLLETEKAARKRLEDDLAARQRRVEGLERKQSATVSEMEKGNEVIKKLQAELRQLLKKLESRSQLAVKQEKAVTRLEEELTAAREQARSAERQAQQKVDEIADLKDQISSLQKKLEESKQLLRSNDNVIQWLNKQINESQARSAAPGAGMGAKKFDHAVPAALQSYRPAVPLTSSAASAAATASAATAAAPPIGLDSKYLHRTAAGSGLANGGSRIPPPHPPGTSAAPGAPATSGQMSLTSAYFPGAVK
ncbi:hypothetical protein BOX15_Mlig010195g2 [Macrostomum lignano]|uniref:Spindle assembly abnormal protein 6 N-terminal domain-containing protein n=2 Tax=Macrostomum lignano TaxID=282301 RepID=A0A267DNM1_9PLAT|nr:hypothetical protein BOX15_Mlig010195g2 [Macrostomum lignano]